MDNILVSRPQPPDAGRAKDARPAPEPLDQQQQLKALATIAASFPQLTFQFLNTGADKKGIANVVYIAQNTTINQIDLQIMLNTGSSTLVQGDVVPPEQLPPTGQQTLLYLDLSALQLGDAAWKLLKPAATGWNCVPYPDDQVIGMSPSAAGVQLQSGTPLNIHLIGFELDKAPPSQTPQLSVTYYNVPGVTSGNTSWTSNFTVAVQNSPSGDKDLTQVLDVSLASNIVINSFDPKRTVKNKLTLEFKQTAQNIGVPAGPDTLFTVSFVYGKDSDKFGYGALTDVTNARNIKPIKGDNADQWQPTSNTDAESPNWTLQPPDGVPIAGSGVQAVVSWSFAPIVTTYQPGPTVMLVQYKNVPGYQDGVFTLLLNKIPHVVVHNVSVTPQPAFLDKNGQAQVTVSWNAEYATSLQLTQNFDPSDVTNNDPPQAPATLTAQSTSFTLTAKGPGADIDNVDYFTAQAVALPVINSFIGTPTEIYSGGGPHDVKLNWAVDTTGGVSLNSTTGDVSGGGFLATDHTIARLKQPQLITLTPTTDPGVIGPTRNLIISAFTPVVQTHSAGAATSGAAASPTAPLLALVNPTAKQVIAIDTVQFTQIGAAAVGKSPTGVVFSPDGSLMVTLNGDATISLHQVAISNGVPSFTSLGTVSLPGNPQAAVVTPRGRIYVSVDGQPGSVVAVDKSGNTYTAGTPVAVGNAPRGLAVDPAGARLYVANSADNSITTVGIGIDGRMQQTGLAQSTGSQPTGLAVTPDGTTLLAACKGSGYVLAIDANNTSTGNRMQLAVGSNPTQVAVTPGGAYAFVANSGDGSVSLLNVWGGPTSCSVLQKTIAVGTNPSGVAVSPDGSVVLVSDSGAQNFGVIALQTFAPASVATQVGGQPTDVAVSSDASAVLIWHNAMFTGQQIVPGARYYPVASGVATQILSDVPMVECVFAPTPPAGGTSSTAYAIGNAGAVVYVIDLSDPANPKESNVRLPINAHTLGLALSSDGETLFVVIADRSLQYTLLVGSVNNGTWTAKQSLQLYKGQRTGPVRMAVTPKGDTLFIADVTNHVFNVLKRDNNGQYALQTTGLSITDPMSVAILPDGSKAYVLGGGATNTITVIDVATLQSQPVSVLQSYVDLQQLVASPDGRRFYAPDRSAGALRIIDPASMRILQTLPLAPSISQAQGAAGIAIAPDGSRIFVANTGSATMSVLQQITM